MINHARTLLANLSPTVAGDITTSGGEIIDPNFQPLALTSALAAAHRLLFGDAPDLAMMNYRLHQYMTVLHMTELAEFVEGLDPRITYLNNPSPLIDLPRWTAAQISGDTAELFLVGERAVTDNSSRLSRRWLIEQLDDDEVTIQSKVPLMDEHTETFTTSGGKSSLLALDGVAMQFQFKTLTAPAEYPKWIITANLRPKADLGTVTETTYNLSESHAISLFARDKAVGKEEPYPTFYRLWSESKELPYRLGGFLMGYIWTADRLYRGL